MARSVEPGVILKEPQRFPCILRFGKKAQLHTTLLNSCSPAKLRLYRQTVTSCVILGELLKTLCLSILYAKSSQYLLHRVLVGSKLRNVWKVPSMMPAATAAAKSRPSCSTLCDPIDGSPPGSSIHGILQARVLEWSAIAFSKYDAWHKINSIKISAIIFLILVLFKMIWQEKHLKVINYQLLHIYESESHSVMSNSLWPHGLYSAWNSPGQNTGVGSLPFLHGIFPTQGLNPGILHYRKILYQLSHKWSPRILEWVAYPFSRGSSQPRNWTGVSCIAGRFFTNWAIRECLCLKIQILQDLI